MTTETTTATAEKVMKQGKLYLGKCDGYNRGRKVCKAFITWELELKDKGPCFSAQAEVWNSRETDILQGGQCVDTVAAMFKGNKKAQRIAAIWAKYHLNDMKAGLPEQEKQVALWKAQYPDMRYDYTKACAMLISCGKYEMIPGPNDKATGSFPEEVTTGKRGYRYRERWVYSAIPQDVIDEITSW